MTTTIPKAVSEKVGRNLHNQENHPIKIVKDRIFSFFKDCGGFRFPERLDPIVEVENNFDKLLIPSNHVSRSPSDTYYVSQDMSRVLRTHMTAEMVPLVTSGNYNYITCGDVYRKDAIDSTHYPVFHQIEGFMSQGNPSHGDISVEESLRIHLHGLIKHLFGDTVKYRFMEEKDHPECSFPFTYNSLEVEVTLTLPDGTEKAIEVLGAGTVQPRIMEACGLSGKSAWAFGMGLERLAMLFYGIPDIRLFWSTDHRFLSQFKEGDFSSKFQPFSSLPACYKDVAFWLGDKGKFTYNDFCNIIKEECEEDIVEEVILKDTFTNGKTGKVSECYRIVYRHPSRTLSNEEINTVQDNIRNRLEKELDVTLR